MSFNLQEVERELHKMQPQPKLYDLVKREMQAEAAGSSRTAEHRHLYIEVSDLLAL